MMENTQYNIDAIMLQNGKKIMTQSLICDFIEMVQREDLDISSDGLENKG